MARSVQEITSFTLVSIIIHNVINNKAFLYKLLINPLIAQRFVRRGALIVTFIELQISTIQLEISPNRQYLEISSIDL